MTHSSKRRSPRRSTREVATGLLALLALLLAVVGLPVLLYVLAGVPLPHHAPSPGQITHALTQRDNGQLFLWFLLLVGWVGWAVFTASVVIETVAQVRGRVIRGLPALDLPRRLAGSLVASVVLLLISNPTSSARPTAPPPLALGPATITVASVSTPSIAEPEGLNAHSTATVVDERPHAPSDEHLPIYTVVRGDSLWSIAEKHLGDPERWRQIARLNYDRPQADGRALTESHWIYPGWTLRLPTDATGVPRQEVRHGSRERAVPDPRPKPPEALDPPPAPIKPPNEQQPAIHRHDSGGINLDSGSWLGAAFAAGVLTAVSSQRLRRRRRYRPHEPVPGRAISTHEPDGTTVSQLRAALRAAKPTPAQASKDSTSLAPVGAASSRTEPDLVDVGEKHGETVALRLTGWRGLAVIGEGAEDVVRAWLAALVSQAGAYGAEILAPSLLLDRLLPDAPPMPALRRLSDIDAVIREAEMQIVGRSRKLEDGNAPDADGYRRSNPEDPLPVILLVADGVEPSLRARWNAVLAQGTTFGIDALVVETTGVAAEDIATAAIHIGSDCTVASARPEVLNHAVGGARPYRLRPADAVELLRPLASMALPVEDEPYPTVDTVGPEAKLAQDAAHSEHDAHDADRATSSIDDRPPTEPWPDVPEPDPGEGFISVELLGTPRICVAGTEVATGLRSGARELFTWFLLHPEGATAGAAIDDIWPEVPPDRGPQRFWTALGNLRSRLRDLGERHVEVITKSGEHYHPEFGVLDVDVWRFQAALRDCANTNPVIAMGALERATNAYRADLVQGLDYLWVEPFREDLHRRALDAHARLAELQDAADLLDAAIETLDRAITIDPVAEELYRRLIELLARAGRHDAISRTWARLVTNLADLDLDPDAETVTLMRRVSASEDPAEKRRQRLAPAGRESQRSSPAG